MIPQDFAPKKILILLPRQLGDIIVGTPVAAFLKKHYPTAEIHWWAHPMGKSILEGNPNLTKSFYYPAKDKNKFKTNNIFKLLILYIKYFYNEVQFAFSVIREKYDLVVDVINYPRSAILSYLTNAKYRLSFQTKSIRDIVYTHTIPREKLETCYLGISRLFILTPLGFSINPEELKNIETYIPMKDQDKVKPRQWLCEVFATQEFSKCEKQYFVMSPTHKHYTRRWPSEKYVTLAFELIKKTNKPVVWLRAPGEDEYISKIHNDLKSLLKQNSLNENLSQLPPIMTLNESAVLASSSIGWIGNSNGMSHTAVASGAKTIEIHGSSVPKSWTHPNYMKHRSIQRNVGCVACSSNHCKLGRRECLEDLDIKTVYDVACDLFELENKIT